LDEPRRLGRFGDAWGGDAELIEGVMPDSGTPVWLVDHPLYDREGGAYQDQEGHDWPDNALRFGLLSWAAARLAAGIGPVDWLPDVLHVQDWQASLAPAYLKVWPVRRPGS